MNKTKVFINGSEGTTGMRILERFAGRDDIELIPIDSELRKDPEEVKKKINESDITFLCLPDAASIEAVSYVENPNSTRPIVKVEPQINYMEICVDDARVVVKTSQVDIIFKSYYWDLHQQ